jgi:hypothetical protein
MNIAPLDHFGGLKTAPRLKKKQNWAFPAAPTDHRGPCECDAEARIQSFLLPVPYEFSLMDFSRIEASHRLCHTSPIH